MLYAETAAVAIYIYIYIYIYTHVHIYLYTYTYTHTHMCVCVYTHTHTIKDERNAKRSVRLHAVRRYFGCGAKLVYYLLCICILHVFEELTWAFPPWLDSNIKETRCEAFGCMLCAETAAVVRIREGSTPEFNSTRRQETVRPAATVAFELTCSNARVDPIYINIYMSMYI